MIFSPGLRLENILNRKNFPLLGILKKLGKGRSGKTPSEVVTVKPSMTMLLELADPSPKIKYV